MLALELAALRGGSCAGIDASPRPAVADRSFDVVTSFEGIWGTTPDALDEVRRSGLLGALSPGFETLRAQKWRAPGLEVIDRGHGRRSRASPTPRRSGVRRRSTGDCG